MFIAKNSPLNVQVKINDSINKITKSCVLVHFLKGEIAFT